ncbi:hypothetical protein GYH30_029455 [Glycine max]|nr:hypothetical protein GYH30_029455 [Glycine max]
MAETNTSNKSSSQLRYVYSFADKVKSFPGWARRATWKVGKEDPRRVVHALKVGMALTLVSLLYLMEPLFKGIGKNAMWAVMTVVVVMEFTVGATLSKGLNRGLGTLLAGSLAFLIEYVADAPGRIFRAVFIGVAVFMLGAMTTYVRFIPYIKKNYDYGVLIFLLTFNLITVSSYRIDNVWNIAKDRMSTIAIGCGLCLVMSILVFPNWSGEDLHNNTISKLEGLANSIQVCVREYFYDSAKEATEDDDSSEDPIYEGYKAVLDSKANDETLALQASWEPRCSRYCHRIPWHQYARVGAALRQFSYTVVALHGCLRSEIQDLKVLMAETNTSSTKMRYIYSYADKLKRFPGLARKAIWKVGKEDPRRVVHSMKVGVALVLVSLLFLLEPLFKGIGKNALWAVMTVVVVMEFTVGATLCKGLNRGIGTLSAGSLAFLIKYFADAPGRIFQAVYIGIAVFMIGALTTYVRFIPNIKKNYDYGVLIFLLTFNLITVSSYRVDYIWDFARDRIYTIAIGCGLCLVMTILVFPNWSGEDLHKNTISKLEGLANSIQVCVREYFYESAKEETEDDDSSEDPIYEGYKAVLDSKAKDETLASQASWEPRFSRYCHKFPWHQYTRVGAALRQFGYTVVALHGCLQSEIQTPKSISTLYKDSCMRLGEEVSNVLRELANSIRNNRQFSPQTLSNNLNEALQDLDNALKSQPQLVLGLRNGRTRTLKTAVQAIPLPHPDQKLEEDTKFSFTSLGNCSSTPRLRQSVEHSRELKRKVLRPQMSMTASAIISLEFSEALPFAAFTSLLVEMVAKLDHVMVEVYELGLVAHFKEFQGDEIVVTCEKPNMNRAQNDLPSHGAE